MHSQTHKINSDQCFISPRCCSSRPTPAGKKHLPITSPTRGRQVPLVFYPEFNNLLRPQSRVRKEDNNIEKLRTVNGHLKGLSKLPILKTHFVSESHTSIYCILNSQNINDLKLCVQVGEALNRHYRRSL